MKYKAKMLKVIDGDTVDFRVSLGLGVYQNCRCRLVGFDAPEIVGVSNLTADYKQGLIIRLSVVKWFAESGNVVNLICEHRDIYSRVLVKIEPLDGGQSLNCFLIAKYGKTKYPPMYAFEPLLVDDF